MSFLSLHSLKKYIFSVLTAIAVTIVLLALISVIFSFFPPSPRVLGAVSEYSFVFTALLSSFLSARSSSGKGLLTGVITAALCLVLISAVGTVFFKSGNFFRLFLKALPVGLVCGAIGGILGINSK